MDRNLSETYLLHIYNDTRNQSSRTQVILSKTMIRDLYNPEQLSSIILSPNKQRTTLKQHLNISSLSDTIFKYTQHISDKLELHLLQQSFQYVTQIPQSTSYVDLLFYLQKPGPNTEHTTIQGDDGYYTSEALDGNSNDMLIRSTIIHKISWIQTACSANPSIPIQHLMRTYIISVRVRYDK